MPGMPDTDYEVCPFCKRTNPSSVEMCDCGQRIKPLELNRASRPIPHFQDNHENRFNPFYTAPAKEIIAGVVFVVALLLFMYFTFGR